MKDPHNSSHLPFLNILTSLPTAVWVYDDRSQAMVWGNPKALEVWDVSSQDELRKFSFSWMSEATSKLMGNYVLQYENQYKAGIPLTHHTDIWTIYPKGKLHSYISHIANPKLLHSIFIQHHLNIIRIILAIIMVPPSSIMSHYFFRFYSDSSELFYNYFISYMFIFVLCN